MTVDLDIGKVTEKMNDLEFQKKVNDKIEEIEEREEISESVKVVYQKMKGIFGFFVTF